MYNLRNYNYKRGKALRNAVYRYMDKFLNEIKDIDYKDNVALVATSSTPLRLAAAIANMPKYDKFMADGMCVSVNQLNDIIGSMLKMNYKERANSSYIGPNRAPIFVAALVIFKAIYDKLGVSSMVASLKAAQEAIVDELL